MAALYFHGENNRRFGTSGLSVSPGCSPETEVRASVRYELRKPKQTKDLYVNLIQERRNLKLVFNLKMV